LKDGKKLKIARAFKQRQMKAKYDAKSEMDCERVAGYLFMK
jgi:hypothetical protein